MAEALPIVSNPTALAINQQFVDARRHLPLAGGMVRSSTEKFSANTAHGAGSTSGPNASFPVWQVWAKPQPQGCVAVLLINLASDQARDLSISLADLGLDPAARYQATDVWSGKQLAPPAGGQWKAEAVAPHGSEFAVLAPAPGAGARQ